MYFLLFKINDVIICCQKERNTLFLNGGQYMNKNEITKIVLSELLEEFYPKDKKKIDWMGNPLTNKNRPTYHHIEEVHELRTHKKDTSATRENGAILGVKSHRKLNILQTADPDLYECWNYLFKVINGMGVYPIDDVWKMVYSLKEKTEDTIYQKKLSRKENNC